MGDVLRFRPKLTISGSPIPDDQISRDLPSKRAILAAFDLLETASTTGEMPSDRDVRSAVERADRIAARDEKSRRVADALAKRNAELAEPSKLARGGGEDV